MPRDTRIALRTNIELTRQNFHQLLNTIPEEALTQPGHHPAWTNGELLVQLCMAPGAMLSTVKEGFDYLKSYFDTHSKQLNVQQKKKPEQVVPL